MKFAKKSLLIATLSVAVLGNVACTSTSVSNVMEDIGVTNNRGIPTDYPQFLPIIAVSKVKLSKQNKQTVQDSFYVDKASESLVFTAEGYKASTELHLRKTFKTDEAEVFNSLSVKVMPIDPRDSVKNSSSKRDEMSFLQVHNKGTADDGNKGVGYIPHPLLRIVYDADRSGMRDHYWAVIKNNSVNCSKDSGNKGTSKCQGSYLRIDLGPVKKGAPSDIDIILGDSTLLIRVDGEPKVSHDITYWKDMLTYFKVGVVNNFEKGHSEVRFQKMVHSVDSMVID